MSRPQHRTAEACSYFVTTKCAQSRSVFQIPENATLLLDVLFRNRDKGAYLLHEFVVMPDHLHLVLTPSETTSLEKAVQLIKGGFSFAVHKLRGHKMDVWQQGLYDWTIRNVTDWQSKSEYIAMNPVRAGLAGNFRDWPYSSASGKFILDPMPDGFLPETSGAKAPSLCTPAQGLKPLPPIETPTARLPQSRGKAGA